MLVALHHSNLHRHVVNFIPGTAANEVNIQAYLLEGLARWNQSRMVAAVNPSVVEPNVRSFDTRLMTKINSLEARLYGTEPLRSAPKLSCYTGELLGVEYLLQ